MNSNLAKLIENSVVDEYTLDDDYEIIYKGHINPCIKIIVEMSDGKELYVLIGATNVQKQFIEVDELEDIITSANKWYTDDCSGKIICTHDSFTIDAEYTGGVRVFVMDPVECKYITGEV